MRLLGYGKANAGQLGVSEKPSDHYDTPVFIEGNVWLKVKCGGYHTAALTVNGNLFVWGAGWNGQLGLPKNVQKQHVPRPISILEDGTVVSKVACGTSHTVVVTSDKKVFTWGGDSGEAALRQINFPNGVSIKSVAAGNAFTLAISSDGQVYSWGTGLDGRLGIGNTRNFRNPQKVPIPSNESEPVKVVHVAAGKAHGLALTANGQVFSWGCGTKGQLGHGNEEAALTPLLVSTLPEIKRIAVGEAHSIALTTKGVVFAWGDGENGQLGLPNVPMQNTPTVVSTLPEEVKIVRIAAGQFHTLAISEYGDVFAWGNNAFGQLGTGNTENSSGAVYLDTLPERAFAAKAAAGERHTFILVTEYNRFDTINLSKYKASLQPTHKPSPRIGGGAVITRTPPRTPPRSPTGSLKRKSVRRSVKFNLETAFSEMEGDLVALQAHSSAEKGGEGKGEGGEAAAGAEAGEEVEEEGEEEEEEYVEEEISLDGDEGNTEQVKTVVKGNRLCTCVIL